MSGNNFNDYKERRKLTGKLKLENKLHEDALNLLVDGYSKSEVAEMLSNLITADEINALLVSPKGQRRHQYIQQQKARAEYVPQTPEECLLFAKKVLITHCKNATQDRSRILAAKQLAEIAMAEQDKPRKATAPSASGDLDELKDAFKGEGGK